MGRAPGVASASGAEDAARVSVETFLGRHGRRCGSWRRALHASGHNFRFEARNAHELRRPASIEAANVGEAVLSMQRIDRRTVLIMRYAVAVVNRDDLLQSVNGES